MLQTLTLDTPMEMGNLRTMSLEERILLAGHQDKGVDVYLVDLENSLIRQTGVRLITTTDLPQGYAIGHTVIWATFEGKTLIFPASGNYGLMERESLLSEYEFLPHTLESVIYAIDPDDIKCVYVVEKRVYSRDEVGNVFSLATGFDDRFPVYMVNDRRELLEVLYRGKCYDDPTETDFQVLKGGMEITNWSPLFELLFPM